MVVDDLYHNRQYTETQVATIAKRKQPTETFNVVKAFTRLLQGYFSTQINTVQVKPRKPDSVEVAGVLNDLVNDVIAKNQFATIYDNLKKDLMLTGMMVVYIDVVETGEKDSFVRPRYFIEIDRVPPREVRLDPMSRRADYGDAGVIHRFKWLSADSIKDKFGASWLNKLDAGVIALPTRLLQSQKDS